MKGYSMTGTPPDPIATLTTRIDSFPALPMVVERIMALTADPESSAEDLMKVISQDQALATAILKMANSAFFGMARRVSSLQQAVTVLGFKEIRNLVLARSVFRSFKTLSSEGQFDIHRFWEHSFSCGLAAKIIGAELNMDKNECFVAGLIHDIGKLVIYLALPMKFSEIVNKAGHANLMTFDAEKITLGITHDKVGMDLLNKWLFPENLISAVGFHHQPHESKVEPLFSMTVFAADLLVHISELDNDAELENSLKQAFLSPEITDFFYSYGVKWQASALDTFQQALTQKKDEEAGIMGILLS